MPIRGVNTQSIDHGLLAGLTDDDHTQYIRHNLSTAANDFLIGSGSNTYTKKTLAETGAILEGDINHDNLVGFAANEHFTETSIDHGNITGLGDDDHSIYALLAGRSGGQTLIGDTDASGSLILQSTAHATKGKILFGTSAYDEVNNRLGIGIATPEKKFHVDVTANNDGFKLSRSGDTKIQFDTNASSDGRFRLWSGTGTQMISFIADGAGLIKGNDNAFELQNAAETSHLITTTNGIVINEGGVASEDFRVEGSGQANALFVDGTQGNIGIRINTPLAPMHFPDNTAIGLGNVPDALIDYDSGTDALNIVTINNTAITIIPAGTGNTTIGADTVSVNYDLMLAGDGVLGLKETTTPTADTNYGKVYTKNDNKLYFQDGAGVEKEIAFV